MFNLTLQSFVGTLVISAVVFLFVVGVFAGYFGKGKTGKGGTFMMVLSVVLSVAYYVLLRLMVPNFSIVLEILEPALFFLVAMVIGAGIGLVIFIAILVKS